MCYFAAILYNSKHDKGLHSNLTDVAFFWNVHCFRLGNESLTQDLITFSRTKHAVNCAFLCVKWSFLFIFGTRLAVLRIYRICIVNVWS